MLLQCKHSNINVHYPVQWYPYLKDGHVAICCPARDIDFLISQNKMPASPTDHAKYLCYYLCYDLIGSRKKSSKAGTSFRSVDDSYRPLQNRNFDFISTLQKSAYEHISVCYNRGVLSTLIFYS